MMKQGLMSRSTHNMSVRKRVFTVGMLGNRLFYFGSVSVGFSEKLDSVRNEFGLVKKTQFGSDIVVIYYSCNSKYYSDSE